MPTVRVITGWHTEGAALWDAIQAAMDDKEVGTVVIDKPTARFCTQDERLVDLTRPEAVEAY